MATISKLYNTKSITRLMNIRTGDVYVTDNLAKFAEEMGINLQNLYNLTHNRTRRCGDYILDPQAF